jgi:hypothetical protein
MTLSKEIIDILSISEADKLREPISLDPEQIQRIRDSIREILKKYLYPE